MFLRPIPTTRAAAFALAAALFTSAFAQDEKGAALDPSKAGIPVYPGAQADAGASAFVRESLHLTASTYRTRDDVAKVAEFYSKQGGITRMPGADKTQAAFSAGCKDEYNPYMKKNLKKCGYNVTIQNPWMDMKTGQLVHDTLITIARQ
jgi:hypothetical protein